MANGDTKTNQYLDIAANGSRADLPSDTCCETRTQTLIRGVAERIMDVEDEVERLENNPDVADIVATYADLQAYDTSQLTDKDVIRVLQDETHDGDSTYYRWSTSTNTWTYIGESKQYTDFVGTDGTTAGEAGLVPAPATTDVGKFLKADGTWDTAGSNVNVVQMVGTSTTDVMSQKAVTDTLFHDIYKKMIQIGDGASSTGGDYFSSVAIGRQAQATAQDTTAVGALQTKATARAALAVGSRANVNAQYGTALGYYALARYQGSVGLGAYSNTSAAGEVHIGSTDTSYGYNNSNYRLLTGLYDPQNAHDAATKGYVDTAVAGAGGGSIAVYISMSLLEAPSSISASNPLVLYKDAAMTQPFSASEIDSMSAGLDNIVMLCTDGSGYTERYSMNSINIDSTDLYWYIDNMGSVYFLDFGGGSHSGVVRVNVLQ